MTSLRDDLQEKESGVPFEKEMEESDGIVPESGLDFPLRRVQRQSGFPTNLKTKISAEDISDWRHTGDPRY